MEQNDGKGLSIAALVLGIISIISFWLPMWNTVSLIVSIIGLVLGIKGRQACMSSGAPTGMATAGLVLSIIGLVFAVIGFLSCTVCTLCIAGAAAIS